MHNTIIIIILDLVGNKFSAGNLMLPLSTRKSTKKNRKKENNSYKAWPNMQTWMSVWYFSGYYCHTHAPPPIPIDINIYAIYNSHSILFMNMILWYNNIEIIIHNDFKIIEYMCGHRIIVSR